MRIGFVGTGNVGQTLAQAWFEAGYKIAAVFNRTKSSATMLAKQVDAVVCESPEQVVELCDVIFLTVTDDAIKEVAQNIQLHNLYGKSFIHTSGVYSSMELESLLQRGAVVGSLHPALPFADVNTAKARLKGATYAIESNDARLRDDLIDLVVALDGVVLEILAESKSLYHAALVIASNYTVTLYHIAEHLLQSISTDDVAIKGALNALVAATIENLQTQSTANALTGPLVRGDVETIQSHLSTLYQNNPDAAEVYRLLARQTYPLLEKRGVTIQPIENLFLKNGKLHDTYNDSRHPDDEKQR